MKRNEKAYHIVGGQYKILKQQMLSWANRFSILLYLDSNNYNAPHSSYECLLGVADDINMVGSLEELKEWHQENNDWLFGHINYDYKNELEPRLSSRHTPTLNFQEFYFFCPQVVFTISKDKQTLTIASLNDDCDELYTQIISTGIHIEKEMPKVEFIRRTTKGDYLNTVNKLRQHIEEGDCYEINYCTKGYAQEVEIEPLSVFNELNILSPSPYAAYYRNDDKYLMCSSPERYIKKEGSRLLSQPIKGTIGRGRDEQEDEQNKKELLASIKDRAENVMITDLVRNDLARCSEVGSVCVEELFGIYSFPQVHQMISTVSAKLSEKYHFTDAIKYSFPMGSMTGAPKIKVMELIEEYEEQRRELFSGTVGYITPDDDFDFNVIIRSLFYNSTDKYLSYQTGGAITYDSDAQKEYEEMRLKAWALERVFQ